jgi:hypothetical protein
MTRNQTKRIARLVALIGSLALLVLLSLDWHSAEVDVVGVVHAEGTVVGWSRWGLLGGLSAAVVAIVAFADLRAGDGAGVRRFMLAVLPPVGMLVGTALAAFSGDAHVNVVGVTNVQADSILWPAWFGLVLAALAAVAALLPVVLELSDPVPHDLPGRV